MVAKAEKVLNRTLAYQAALIVHELKESLGVDVKELHLTVKPLSLETPGSYTVTCTIADIATPIPIVLELVVEPEKAITRTSKNADD